MHLSATALTTATHCCVASQTANYSDCSLCRTLRHARLMTSTRRSRRSEHIAPIIKSLHWLPVRQRVTFKLATLVYKCLYGHAPAYLADDCHLVTGYPRLQNFWLSLGRAYGTACLSPFIIHHCHTRHFQDSFKTHLFV